MEKDIYKTSRFMYILEAAFEYFVSILVGGAFLAKAASGVGLSDSTTGILTSFVSLGCSFQIVAVFLANKRPVKRWVTVLHTLNQLLFALVYFVPFFKVGAKMRGVLFALFLLLGWAVNYSVNSPKINWFMELVDDKKRGAFTATKEIVSLLGGMVVSLTAGRVIDKFEAVGNDTGAFLFCGLAIVLLTALHTTTLLCSKEKPVEEKVVETSTKERLKGLFKNKDLFKVVFVGVLWHIVTGVSTPFYGTYQIKELGFSMTFVSVLAVLSGFARAFVSRPLGKYADKTSFQRMLNICMAIELVSYAVAAFAVPSNGKVVYTIYYVTHCIGLGGVNSSLINFVYDYVERGERTVAFALSQAFGGLTGFLTTLCVSPLVKSIQKNGNHFLGLHVYAQQVVSVFSVIALILLTVYLNTVVKKLKNKRG